MTTQKQGNSTAAPGDGNGPAVEPVKDGVANKLKEFFSEIESEGIPDRLVMLLDKLDEAEKAHAAKANSQDNSNG